MHIKLFENKGLKNKYLSKKDSLCLQTHFFIIKLYFYENLIPIAWNLLPEGA